jgi:hypothetical protein
MARVVTAPSSTIDQAALAGKVALITGGTNCIGAAPTRRAIGARSSLPAAGRWLATVVREIGLSASSPGSPWQARLKIPNALAVLEK